MQQPHKTGRHELFIGSALYHKYTTMLLMCVFAICWLYVVCAFNRVLYQLTTSIPADICQHVAAVAFDGTSATAMLVDQQNGQMLAPVKLYNASQSSEAVAAAKVGGGPTCLTC